jgi:hypothetical protein
MNSRRIRTLAGKELHRLALNRGAIVMAFFLLASALLVSAANRSSPVALGPSTIQTFWVDYWEDGPWVRHLREHVPGNLNVQFRSVADIPTDRAGTLQYARTDGAVQLRREGELWRIWFWHPGEDSRVLAPFEEWFWSESRQFFHRQAVQTAPESRRAEIERMTPPPLGGDPAKLLQDWHRQYRDQLLALAPHAVGIPEIAVEHSSLHSVGLAKALSVALILFAIFFVGVCLMPSLTCEERERGTLLAQTLSPATPLEMLFAKLLVFVPIAAGLATIVGVFAEPELVREPLFPIVILIAATGAFGVGSVIALLVPTQRAASLSAMGYAMAVALIVFAAQRIGTPAVSRAFLEVHLPPLLVASLDGNISGVHWRAAFQPAILAGAWLLLAGLIASFRGWRPA